MKKNALLKIFILAFAMILGATGTFAFSFRDISLKFVQLSDTHISDRESTPYKLLKQSNLLLTSAVKQINSINGVDFVVFTGDMVDEPTEAYYNDFFTALTELKYPVIMAFGNHDTLSYSKDKTYLTKEEALALVKKYNPNYPFGKTYYAFNPKPDYHIIVLDLSIPDAKTANGEISQEQLAFLEDELEKNKNNVVLIFQHFPVLEPFESEHHKVINADKYFEVIRKYKNPIVIFSGHYHTTKIIREDNIIHVSSPALVTYPNAFRLVNITNYKDRAIFDFYFYETDLKELQAQSKASTISFATFLGKEKDQECSITIYKDAKKNKKDKEAREQEEELDE
jgi:3',5'-cyclic AMP phosphodiesterase CpdA